jgi:hypothetical protein
MIGALQLARALADRDLSGQLLARSREAALKLLDNRHDCMQTARPATRFQRSMTDMFVSSWRSPVAGVRSLSRWI